MRNSFINPKILIIFCVFFISKEMYAQLGFCQGNSGDPIFTETFGTGASNTPLPAGTTTYTFANTNPQDGFYTVSNNTATDTLTNAAGCDSVITLNLIINDELVVSISSANKNMALSLQLL